MFFWNSLTFSVIQRMLATWTLVPLCFLNPAWIFWKFIVHVLLKPGLENFEHYFTSVWDACNCEVVWAFFGIGMKTDLLQSCGHCWVSKLNFTGASLLAQTVKNLPAMQETHVRSLGCPWKREWLPILVFLPGEFHGWRSLVGCSPWGLTESDMTEAT